LGSTSRQVRNAAWAAFDCVLGVLLRRLDALADDLTLVRRVDRVDRVRRRDLPGVDDERICLAELALDRCQGVLYRLAFVGPAEVGERFVLKMEHSLRACGTGLAERVLHLAIRWVHEQFLLGDVLRKAGPQEGSVRGILEQPTHQVRHAGQQLAVRCVNAHTLAEVDERILDRVGMP